MSPLLMAGPEEIVNPPLLRAEPCGLLRTLDVLNADDRILGGIRHRPENVSPLVGLDPCANTAVTPLYTGLPPRVGRAFVVQEIDECGTFGWKDNEYEERATRGLLAKESMFVEAELERAVTVPDNPHLAQPGSVAPADLSWAINGNEITSASAPFRQYMEGWTLSGNADFPAGTTIRLVLDDSHVLVSELATVAGAAATVTFTDPGFRLLAGGQAVSPSVAIAYLNQAIADAQIGLGLIHVPAFAGERALEGRAVVTPGASSPSGYFSVNGNPIVVGNGYTGIGPDGTGTANLAETAPGATVYQWAYATDLIQAYRNESPTVYPPTLAEALERSINLVAYRATRPYALNWSGLLRAAVKVAVTTGTPT